MLLCNFPALVTPSPRTFIIKVRASNGKDPPSCPFPVLLTPSLVIAFTNEEATGCINEKAIVAINEAAIDAIIAPRNPPS